MRAAAHAPLSCHGAITEARQRRFRHAPPPHMLGQAAIIAQPKLVAGFAGRAGKIDKQSRLFSAIAALPAHLFAVRLHASPLSRQRRPAAIITSTFGNFLYHITFRFLT
jgi:hypothetical protein